MQNSLAIRVKDFQIIQDVSLSIKGITLVVGSNNNGKSSLVRALYAAIYNRQGSNFIRDGQEDCSVESR